MMILMIFFRKGNVIWKISKLRNWFVMIWKEFCKIIRWTEDNYNPQLDYIEYDIYEVYSEISISDYELQDVICVVMYDLKEYWL